MKTIEETKNLLSKILQLNEKTVGKVANYLSNNDFVYAVCEEPEDFKILGESYEFKQ